MLARSTCTPIRSLSRITLQRTPFRPWRIRRNYAGPKKSNSQAYNDPVPTPANLRRLRSKEHMLRKAIIRGFLAATVVAYYLDGKYNARAIRRTLRTAWVGATLAADYKWNFTFRLPIVCAYDRPEKAESIEDLHKRVARRVMELISANGGLYIKLGQALAMQAAVLPPAYGEAFSTLFDEAPQMSYEDVVAVFKRDFGKTPEEIFDTFETQARASASIATVFKARLKSGEWVAVKVQKPEIEKQVQWDLFAYRVLMYIYDRWLFKIPVYFTVDYISRHLLAETNFVREARNGARMRQYIEGEPLLRDKILIPKVYPEILSPRVMVADWIDGERITKRKEIEEMGFSMRQVMTTMVDLFSAQIFKFGWVHCDPHPGNVFIRRNPISPKDMQLVLIDHGLYISETESFRLQYCQLWKAILTWDNKSLNKIAAEWGVQFPDVLASATLLSPYKGSPPPNLDHLKDADDAYKAQLAIRDKLRNFLSDTEKIPLELVFLGRNMRIVQATNQLLGSPVNRPALMANWASRGLTVRDNLTWKEKLMGMFDHFKFRFTLGVMELAFWFNRVRQVVFGSQVGWEDLVQRQLKSVAKANFGIELKDDALLS